MSFTPIETQEDFDRAIQKRLEQKDREAETRYKDYLSPDAAAAMKRDYERQISDARDAVKQDYEQKLAIAAEDFRKANEKIVENDQIVSDLTARATKAETMLLKNRVAHENGVPLELADRLSGTTEEELKKDAGLFASFIKPRTLPPLVSTEPENLDKKTAALKKVLQDMRGE